MSGPLGFSEILSTDAPDHATPPGGSRHLLLRVCLSALDNQRFLTTSDS